jgi:sulfofructose kinase
MSSAFVSSQLVQEHVDLSLCAHSADFRPNLSTIIVDESTGTRTILSDPCPIPPVSVGASVSRHARVLLIDHRYASAGLAAVREAERIRVPVVADFERETEPGMDQLLPIVSHLIVPARFASRVTGTEDLTEAVRALWTPARVVVVVTCGDKGSLYTTDGRTVCVQPAFRVEVRDTTGCGDVFHGAYAWGLVHGLLIEECISLASAAAALKATRSGGQVCDLVV